MSSEKKNSKGKINIEIDEKVSEGIYSNLAIINHSVSEFVIDFISIMPGTPKNKVKSRIIITPQHAKKLSKALNDNIKRFEDNFGSIKAYENPNIQLNFGPTGKA
ncbi:MAG TPA: DUF3467 domain-containing protein [Candidatus Marinimicrobia bacterium]|nr:DUF3467 domain-containing protein [Candidatus Neomarinimicrobiota bacterium]